MGGDGWGGGWGYILAGIRWVLMRGKIVDGPGLLRNRHPTAEPGQKGVRPIGVRPIGVRTDTWRQRKKADRRAY